MNLKHRLVKPPLAEDISRGPSPCMTDFYISAIGCVVAQAFFSRGVSAISLKSRVFSV